MYPDLQFRARVPAGGPPRHHRQARPARAGDLPGQPRLQVVIISWLNPILMCSAMDIFLMNAKSK